jgi:uncharacterized SAM-binding protein YcdF (DUF218 family)
VKGSTIEESPSRRPILIIKDSPCVLQKNCVFGIINRKERWGLSWKGWLVIGVLIIGLVSWSVGGVYPFLAVTERVNTNALVVEGWLHEYAVRAAINEFNAGHYQLVFTTGGPVVGTGGYTNDYNTSASVAASRLKAEGFSPDLIQTVPSRVGARDRTYSAAKALRDWFSEHRTTVHGINVVTEDVHARRTRLLFQKALGDGIKVGVIAVPNPDYDPKYWWRYSDGVREIIGESIAYIYARLFFWPLGQEARGHYAGVKSLKR